MLLNSTAEQGETLSTSQKFFQTQKLKSQPLSERPSWREPRGYVEVNREDADRYGVRDGGVAVLTSRRGQVRAQARVSKRVPPGVVFLSFHWREAPANLLTHDFGLDPMAKIPEYKATAVRLENPKAARGR